MLRHLDLENKTENARLTLIYQLFKLFYTHAHPISWPNNKLVDDGNYKAEAEKQNDNILYGKEYDHGLMTADIFSKCVMITDYLLSNL